MFLRMTLAESRNGGGIALPVNRQNAELGAQDVPSGGSNGAQELQTCAALLSALAAARPAAGLACRAPGQCCCNARLLRSFSCSGQGQSAPSWG